MPTHAATTSTLKRKPPKLRHHKASGQGYIQLDGRFIYFGKFDDPATVEKYHRTIAEWMAAGQQSKPPAEELTVKELIARFWLWAEEYYGQGRERMAIDIETETVVSLTEATRIIPPRNGKRVAISTLWRWCRKGINDVRLEYIRVGRNIATSQEALGRFFRALAEADRPARSIDSSGSHPSPSSKCRATPPAARRASLEQADRILERAGI